MKLLGRKRFIPEQLAFRAHAGEYALAASLGPATQLEMNELCAAAFECPAYVWTPDPNSFGAVQIRTLDDDKLVASCELLFPCFLHRVAVTPDFQRSGIGTWLVAIAERLFRLEYTLVSVDETTQPSGHEFWKKLSFVEVGS
jgi:GNAT superfamily N-acetyltransferase